jgi:hypothetical protein
VWFFDKRKSVRIPGLRKFLRGISISSFVIIDGGLAFLNTGLKKSTETSK